MEYNQVVGSAGVTMKTCSKCLETKPISEFHKHKTGKSGVRPDCKECVRKRVADRWAVYRYGLEVCDLNKMIKAQEFRCLGCKTPAGANRLTRHRWSAVGLCIDHDHNTGEVRGLLCHNCNTALGQVKDNPETLRRLADYLERDKI